MDTYHARTQQLLADRFVRLLAAWLQKLPRAGWSGSVDSLGLELDRLNEEGKFFAFVPFKSGLSKTLLTHESAVTAAGWSVSFRRTAKARTIVFTRLRSARRAGG